MAKPVEFWRLRAASAAIALLLGAGPALAAPGDDTTTEAKAEAKAEAATTAKVDADARGESGAETGAEAGSLNAAAQAAQDRLHQTFTNLKFEEFGPSPVKGPIYQAVAGGRVVYYAPTSEHILFATVYDRSGVNVTALAEGASARKRLQTIDPAQALAIGPADAPSVIEFTDPDCPYCRALDKFWAAKAAEGKRVRRLIYFVSGIHAGAAAKAEHILCSDDKEAAFRAIYAGAAAEPLRKCAEGHARVAADAETVRKVGVSGTPTLIVDGRLISGFQQGELEAFLDQPRQPVTAAHR